MVTLTFNTPKVASMTIKAIKKLLKNESNSKDAGRFTKLIAMASSLPDPEKTSMLETLFNHIVKKNLNFASWVIEASSETQKQQLVIKLWRRYRALEFRTIGIKLLNLLPEPQRTQELKEALDAFFIKEDLSKITETFLLLNKPITDTEFNQFLKIGYWEEDPLAHRDELKRLNHLLSSEQINKIYPKIIEAAYRKRQSDIIVEFTNILGNKDQMIECEKKLKTTIEEMDSESSISTINNFLKIRGRKLSQKESDLIGKFLTKMQIKNDNSWIDNHNYSEITELINFMTKVQKNKCINQFFRYLLYNSGDTPTHIRFKYAETLIRKMPTTQQSKAQEKLMRRQIFEGDVHITLIDITRNFLGRNLTDQEIAKMITWFIKKNELGSIQKMLEYAKLRWLF